MMRRVFLVEAGTCYEVGILYGRDFVRAGFY